MGLRDRFAARIATEIVKSTALALKPESTMDAAQLQSLTQPSNGTTPLGAGRPLHPAYINPRNSDGTVEPRKNEFEISSNINVNAKKLVPFPILRQCAEQIDLLARCIYARKSKMLGLKFDIVLDEDAIDKIMRESKCTREKATAIARDQFTDEISRIKEFWKQPDPLNGMTWLDWFGVCLDEVLTIDALAIYPQTNVRGELIAFKIIDGATIKPLIDDYGFRPQPPDPAYQQILYGFPRSDFVSPLENENADGIFQSNELSYSIHNRRVHSVFGQSPTERSLVLADIYLRRQDWLRAEYTDGVMPDIFMETSAEFNGPDERQGYEDGLNDDLAGQTAKRKGIKLLPAGMSAKQLQSYSERFSDVIDDQLMTAIAGHYAVQPTEIGYVPKHSGGLGNSVGKDQADSSNVMADGPFSRWFEALFSNLSYLYLGMPRELKFTFTSGVRDDKLAIAQADDLEAKNFKYSVNERRGQAGQPLIDSPEADYPIMVVGKDAFFMTEEGVRPIYQAPASSDSMNGDMQAQGDTMVETKPVDNPVDNPTDAQKAQGEIKKFLRYANKDWRGKNPVRPFKFEALPPVYADVINKFIVAGDLDTARWYAERYAD